MREPLVELLWWDGCPSWQEALEQLREAMRESGFDPERIDVRHVDSDAEADRLGFVGSPTVLIDGEDIAPPGDEPTGLTCRIYRLRDGRVSPLPDPADLREALARKGSS